MNVLRQRSRPDDHRPYLDALRAPLERTTPDVEYAVVGIRPPDRHLHALIEVRCGIAALRSALCAGGAGYDSLARDPIERRAPGREPRRGVLRRDRWHDRLRHD